ncbi:acetoacetate decarboxylase family protein [Streptomyces sp. YKOK-I1]
MTTVERPAKALFRMPTAFGPQPGPRQRPDGGRWNDPGRGRTIMLSLRVPSDPERLAALLPQQFTLDGDHFTVTAAELRDLPWLAGRGYNVLSVSVPAVHHGTRTLAGDLELVTWESLADPVVSGREELGFNKIYADVSDLETGPTGNTLSVTAAWDGFVFARISAGPLDPPASDGPPPAPRPGLHVRYVPSPARRGEADIEDVTCTDLSGAPEIKVVEARTGEGAVEFLGATFEQLPTLFHIVNPLRDLPVLGTAGATLIETTGYADGYDISVLA